MRNSSLVEGSRAENVTGLSLPPKPWMFRRKVKTLASKVDPKEDVVNWLDLISVGEDPLAREPGGETSGKRVGPFEYRLSVVGERSSGDEATT